MNGMRFTIKEVATTQPMLVFKWYPPVMDRKTANEIIASSTAVVCLKKYAMTRETMVVMIKLLKERMANAITSTLAECCGLTRFK